MINPRVLILIVAVMSIATVAIGLRVGAPEPMRAAIVIGAMPARGVSGVAFQIRTQDDDNHSRTASSTKVTAVLRSRGSESVFHVDTNVDGVAEIFFSAKGLVAGDPIELDLRDPSGVALARGNVTWPKDLPKPTLLEHAILRPSRLEGTLRMRVAVLGGALAPGQPGRVWVTTSATGESPRNLRIEATPDLGLEVDKAFVADRDPLCAKAGVIEIIARGHSGGVALHAKDDLGREGEWYGTVPIAAGAMIVSLPLTAEPGQVNASITSASARALAYVETDDEMGRSEAHVLPLLGEPPHADARLELETPGRHFVVVSGEPDGATTISGATRAIPIWIGPHPPCEAELAETTAQAFPRFVALDGFAQKRAKLDVRRKRGRMIALGGLGLGSLLETLLLLGAAREGRRRLRKLQNAIVETGEPAPRVSRRGPLDILVILVLSLLGFVLLFALIEWTSR